MGSERSDNGREFDRDALAAVLGGQGDDGWTASWEIPVRIPVQRLTGLKRRGYLRFTPQRDWRLSDLGLDYFNVLEMEIG